MQCKKANENYYYYFYIERGPPFPLDKAGWLDLAQQRALVSCPEENLCRHNICKCKQGRFVRHTHEQKCKFTDVPTFFVVAHNCVHSFIQILTHQF